MPTDVMHDETCRVLAAVLAERNQGVVQMTLTTSDPKRDMAHLEELATISGRPLLHNVVQAFEDRPHIHRKQLAWLQRCRERGIPVYGQGVTTDAGFTFTFEDWNLYDDSVVQATTGTKESGPELVDPSAQALKDTPPKWPAPPDTVTVLTPKSPATEPYRQMSVGQAAGRWASNSSTPC
jgi:N-acyl-D-aspartate/D-glutamate deacylase